MPSSVTRLRRVLTVAGAVAATMIVGAGIAAAHVTVSPSSATAGSYTTITFRVPTESDTAATTGVRIEIPASTPIRSVMAEHLPGWTADIVTSPLAAPVTQGSVTIDKAVSSVTFTATDGGIRPGEFATFDLLIGPLPDVTAITFAAVQTYSDGTVVSWNEPATADGSEPEHPAPVLTILARSSGTGTAAESSATTAATASAAATGTTDSLARILAILALLVAIIAVTIKVAVARRAEPPAGNPFNPQVPPQPAGQPPVQSPEDGKQ
jgi:periplasmic copper chaperone A